MFCEQCGARLEAGARFCERCGARVVALTGQEVPLEPLVIPAPPGATVTIADEPPAGPWPESSAAAYAAEGRPSGYTRASSLTEAAGIAAERASEWCPWDDAHRPVYNSERWLMKKARVEDRKYGGTSTDWVVSPDGAIGYEDDVDEWGHDVEWWCFTPAVPYEDLPKNRRDLGL